MYGIVTPVFPPQIDVEFDLAHVFAGGRVVYTSDQHFGVGSNLILPGRGTFQRFISPLCLVSYPVAAAVGKDMGDGWETKRSRQKDHKDWAIIKLYVRLYHLACSTVFAHELNRCFLRT